MPDKDLVRSGTLPPLKPISRVPKQRVRRFERRLLGEFRLYALVLGLIFVAGALLVAVVALFGGTTKAPLFGLAAAALAASGGALSALWATTARVVATRKAAQGALLSQILERYHSEEMWTALERLGRVNREMFPAPQEDAVLRFFPPMVNAQGMNDVLLGVYGGGLERAWKTFDRDRRLVSAFFVSVHRLCSGGFLPKRTAVNAIGASGGRLFVDFVSFVDEAFANKRQLRVDHSPVAFFARMLGDPAGRDALVGRNPYMAAWPPDDLGPPLVPPGAV